MITLDAETMLAGKGLCAIGVDEAGRGALAGPVVAAAVILDPHRIPSGIDDSKRLTAQRRHALATEIRSAAVAWGVGVCSAQHIDRVNILQATFDAMHAAVDVCRKKTYLSDNQLHLLVDGNRFRTHAICHTTIVGGDALVLSIAAASILAKTHRDAIMTDELAPRYPVYGFDRHKGYGTNAHRDQLRQNGPCFEHRKTFLSSILCAEQAQQGGSA